MDFIKFLIERYGYYAIIIFLLYDLLKYIKFCFKWWNVFKNNTQNCANGSGIITLPHLTIRSTHFYLANFLPDVPDKNYPYLTNFQAAVNKLQWANTWLKWYHFFEFFEEYSTKSRNQNFNNYYHSEIEKAKILCPYLYRFVLKIIGKNVLEIRRAIKIKPNYRNKNKYLQSIGGKENLYIKIFIWFKIKRTIIKRKLRTMFYKEPDIWEGWKL